MVNSQGSSANYGTVRRHTPAIRKGRAAAVAYYKHGRPLGHDKPDAPYANGVLVAEWRAGFNLFERQFGIPLSFSSGGSISNG